MTASSRFIAYIFFWGLIHAKFVLIFGDCWYDHKRYEENSEVPTGEPCLNCTCSRSALLCYLRVCPKLPNPPPPGCILLHRFRTCCPELICSDFYDGGNSLEARADPSGDLDMASDDQSLYENACISNGSIYGPGSAMHSSSLCEYCYCLAGKQVCVKPKCLLPMEGCSPIFEESSCCPARYNCTRDYLAAASTEEPITTTMKPTKRLGGCMVDSIHYPEGSKIIGIGHSVCDNCYCLRGLLRCEPLSCAPPLLGCTPLVKDGECCAASYNCNGTLQVKPEPTYGLFPTISKEYSKLRKEVQRKPSIMKMPGQTKNGVVTVAPFYVLPENSHEPTTKLVYQRSPETYGTTRQFVRTKPSSTTSTTEGNFFLISSSKQRSSGTTTTEKSNVHRKVVADIYQNNEATNKIYQRVSSTKQEMSSTETIIQAKEELNDFLDFDNLFSIVGSLLDGNSHHSTNESDMSTTPAPTESTEFTELSTNESTTSGLNDTDWSTTEGDSVVTVTSIFNSTDCIKNELDPSTTVPSIEPNDINNLAEGRTEYVSTTDLISSHESLSTEETSNFFDRNSTNKFKISQSKLAPDIEAILNISKHRNKEEFDYDYNEPTLPPSLPNLKIIPFLAADALDDTKESPKDPIQIIEDKMDRGPLIEYRPNSFKPPQETEGGFVPKDPAIIDGFYNNVLSAPITPTEADKALNCMSNGKQVLHGMSVPSDSSCMTCTCFYGNIACQKVECPLPKPGCNLLMEAIHPLCCPTYDCDKRTILDLQIPPEIVTVAEGIIPLDPFKDVIRTEPAPNLQSLIGDRASLEKISITTSVPQTVSEKVVTTAKPLTENYDSNWDELLKLMFPGTPTVIEKPHSQPSSAKINQTENKINITTNNTTQKIHGPSKVIDKIRLPTKINSDDKNSFGVGLLKLAGCNIYGRMYRVGRIISELSGPCMECKCTETGVQCRQLKCSNKDNV